MRNLILVVLVALFFVGTTEAKTPKTKKVEITVGNILSGSIDSLNFWSLKKDKDGEHFVLDKKSAKKLTEVYWQIMVMKYGDFVKSSDKIREHLNNLPYNLKIAQRAIDFEFLGYGGLSPKKDINTWKKDVKEAILRDIESFPKQERPLALSFIKRLYDPKLESAWEKYYTSEVELSSLRPELMSDSEMSTFKLTKGYYVFDYLNFVKR